MKINGLEGQQGPVGGTGGWQEAVGCSKRKVVVAGERELGHSKIREGAMSREDNLNE